MFRTKRVEPRLRGLSLFAALFGFFLFIPLLPGQDRASQSELRSPADGSLRRFEIGGQMTDMRLGGCYGQQGCVTPQYGLGVGASWNIDKYLAIDASYDILPRFDSSIYSFSNSVPEGGHASELLIGARGEVRARRFGLFFEAKPGAVSWSKTMGHIVSPTGVVLTGWKGYMATEIGGGVEYSPSPRVHVRFDMDDLLVRYIMPQALFRGWPPNWVNNVQSSAGVYYSVGKPIDWTPPDLNARPSHRFLDSANIALIGVSLLGQSADAMTTQRFIGHGGYEADPLARPFVKYGWSGQIGAAALLNGAEISGMYLLHRMHRHRVERALPLGISVVGGVMGYRNLQHTWSPPAR